MIKFRAWDNENDVFFNPFRHHSDNFDNLLSKKNRYSIQQYIGLKDKNGRDIYVGDFLKDSEGYVGEVVYSQNAIAPGSNPFNGAANLIGFAVVFDDLKDYPVLLSNEKGNTPANKTEIIGNIFEK